MAALAQVANFANNAAAVEKSLRLGQAITMIGGSLQPTVEAAAPYVLARSQLNLSRRFLRLFKWIDNFNAAGNAIASSKDSVPKMLETAKFTFLGIYFFMEFISITDVMGLSELSPSGWIVVESNRMWFYALILGILQAVWEGLLGVQSNIQQTPNAEKKVKGKKSSTEKPSQAITTRKGLPYKQLLIDSCDLAIPGSVIQAVSLSPLAVGCAMALSTVLQLSDMWPRIQAQAASAAARGQ